jgi:hypothetical protein
MASHFTPRLLRVLSWPAHGASIKVVRYSKRHGEERSDVAIYPYRQNINQCISPAGGGAGGGSDNDFFNFRNESANPQKFFYF